MSKTVLPDDELRMLDRLAQTCIVSLYLEALRPLVEDDFAPKRSYPSSGR
jgi:hypothetical protein